MSLQRLTVAAVSFLVAGCVVPPAQQTQAIPPYVPPATGATAKLLVRTVQPAGSTTLVSTFEQPVACSRRALLDRSTTAEPPRTTHTLRANRLHSLSFVQIRGDRRGCELIISFEPKANRTYLMRNRASPQGCEVELIDATNPDQPFGEPSAQRRERKGAALAEDACQPITSTAAPRRAASGSDTLPSIFREALPQ